jgi:hypothetical protein
MTIVNSPNAPKGRNVKKQTSPIILIIAGTGPAVNSIAPTTAKTTAAHRALNPIILRVFDLSSRRVVRCSTHAINMGGTNMIAYPKISSKSIYLSLPGHALSSREYRTHQYGP